MNSNTMHKYSRSHATCRMALVWHLFLTLVLLVPHSIITTTRAQAAKVSTPPAIYKNHRMGELAQSDGADNIPASTTTTSPDIVVNSIEEELATVKALGQPGGNRHRYEQQAQTTTTTTQPNDQQQATHQPELSTEAPAKLEPRHQVDTQNEPSNPQGQQQDAVIIDHRPIGGQASGFEQPAEYSTQSSAQVHSTPTGPTTTSTTPSSLMATAQYGQSNGMFNGAQLVPAQWFSGSASLSQNMNGNSQQSLPQFFFATQPVQVTTTSNSQQQQQQQQNNSNQQQQSGSVMSGSNQVVSVQHPTSINSIISEQQASSPNQQQQQQPQQPQMLTTVNGQPVLLVSQPQGAASSTAPQTFSGLPVQQQQLVGIVNQNGRRVSISNWLRGIGSMLANIFNRRDHGGALLQPAAMMAASQANGVLVPSPQQQAAGSSGGSSGNWIQLGPNAPHWLTQAQSALQQLQQQHHQLTSGSNRFTTFIQTPQAQVQPTVQSVAIQPQTMAQASLSNGNYQAAGSDLQPSGSSNSYVSIQSPAGTTLASSQAYQSGPIIVNHIPSSPASGHIQQLPAVSRQQQQVANQQISSRPQASNEPATAAILLSGSASKQQLVTHSASQQQSGHNQPRFSRASPIVNSKPNGIDSSQSTGNLPLAHYSQYGSSRE